MMMVPSKYYHCCWVAQLCPTLLWPHGLYPTRLLCPWDFPGEVTGMGCRHYQALGLQLLKLVRLEPVLSNRRRSAVRSQRTTTKSNPCSPQLEKARAKQWRPSTAKNKKLKKKKSQCHFGVTLLRNFLTKPSKFSTEDVKSSSKHPLLFFNLFFVFFNLLGCHRQQAVSHFPSQGWNPFTHSPRWRSPES